MLAAGFARDDALHRIKTIDGFAVDGSDDIARLKAGCSRGAVFLHHVDPCRRAWLAEDHENGGKDHDRQNEIGNRTGSDNRGARTDLLVMEALAALLRGHRG